MLAKNTGKLSFERCGETLSAAVFACLHELPEMADFPSFTPDYTDSTTSFYTSVYSESAASAPEVHSVIATEDADLQGVVIFVDAPFVSPGFFCSLCKVSPASLLCFIAENAENFCTSVRLVPRPHPSRREQKRKSFSKKPFFRAHFTFQPRSVMRL